MLGAEVYLVAATVLCILGASVLGILCVVFLIRKRWRSAVIAGCATLGLAVAGVACGVTCGGIYVAKSLRIMQPFTGEELFAMTVMKDVPPSVTVLHRLDDSHPLGMDAAYYLHFRISPEDFQKVLTQQPYEKLDAATEPDESCCPEWWQPDALGNDVEIYGFEKPHPKIPDMIAEHCRLWVNPEHSEAYFVLVCY